MLKEEREGKVSVSSDNSLSDCCSYTAVMSDRHQKIEERLDSLVTREKLMQAIKELKRAEKTSARATKLNELYRMLDQVNIPFQKDLKADDYKRIIEAFSREKFENEEDVVMEMLHESLEDFPNPEMYLKRIVDSLEDPEDGWGMDTLRLRLLKRFYKYGNCLKDVNVEGQGFIRTYIKKNTGGKLPKDIDEQVKHLKDDIFDALEGAKKDQLKPNGKFGLLKICQDLASCTFHTGGAPRRNLYYLAVVYQVPLVFDDEIVRINLRPEDGSWQLELEPNWETAFEKGNLIFDSREGKKASFSSKKFLVSLEKSLFHEYYQNNMLRFLENPILASEGKYEVEPAGYGINYGNYTEAIYLYWLVRNLPIYEKFRQIAKMIEQVKNEPGDQSKEGEAFLRTSTRKYREFYNPLADVNVLVKDPDDFVHFLIVNYDTTSQRGYSSFILHSENETARNLSMEMAEYLKQSEDFSPYGIWFTDPGIGLGEQGTERLGFVLQQMHSYLKNLDISDTKQVDRPTVTRTQLMRLFYYFYNQVIFDDEKELFEAGFDQLESKFDLEFDTDLEQAIFDEEGNRIKKSLSEIYRDYRVYLNPLLQVAGFQRIDPKNFFDMALLYSSFVYGRN